MATNTRSETGATPQDEHHEKPEAYMLRRDQEETRRLDEQHLFFKEFFGGHLLHPQIPLQDVKTVADVGTGTGIWLIETANLLKATNGTEVGPCVGFDISADQFQGDPSGFVQYHVHDTTKPYPEEYDNFFDVVHVRLLSYALPADQLERTVQNIVSILKPGGYLHWEEGDCIDSHRTPDSYASTRQIAFIVEERLARGLTPAIVTPLVRTITGLRTDGVSANTSEQEVSYDVRNPKDDFNTLTWNNKDVLRMLQLTTVSSANHSSPFVREKKHAVFNGAGKAFMEIGAARRRKLAATSNEQEKDQLLQQAEEMESYVGHPDIQSSEIDSDLTCLLARKSTFSS